MTRLIVAMAFTILLLSTSAAQAQVIMDAKALDAIAKRRDRVERQKQEQQNQQKASQLDDDQMAVHVLSRFSFGPKPGQIAKVREMGWREWIKQQLDPGNIDDSTLDQKLKREYPSLFMSMSDVDAVYSPPNREQRFVPGTRTLTQAYLRRQREIYRLEHKLRGELIDSVMVRAIESERQLYEMAVEFWRNHFNVDVNKRGVEFVAVHYEQNVIRRHAWGRFEDMLMASAKHPAMLVYLDNFVSQKPLSETEQRLLYKYAGSKYKPRRVEAAARHRGLNENYARELMELHTLGVDNGYTQRDVIEVARVLTGWSVGHPDTRGRNRMNREEGNGEFGFVFREEVHDTGPKRILGTRIKGNGGVADGEAVIRGLARHRITSEFISWKLCRYFVNDEPPKEMVRRVARVFRKTRGHLPKVYEAIAFDPAFADVEHFRAKYKTPFEYIVSSIRAVDGNATKFEDVQRTLQLMGQPIYANEDPTGYYDQAEAWLDPGVLLYRWDFALRLTAGHVNGIRVGKTFRDDYLRRSSENAAQRLADSLIGLPLSDETEAAIAHTRDPKRIAALLLGSPEFQQQ